MSNHLAIIGGGWGDESKGKIVDFIAPQFDVVARYNGGHNAGHTVWRGKDKYALHGVSIGALHKNSIPFLTGGVMADLDPLAKELTMLEAFDPNLMKRFKISGRVSIATPDKVYLDQLTGGEIGTTGRGVGQTYEGRLQRKQTMNGVCALRDVRLANVVGNPSALKQYVADNAVFFMNNTTLTSAQREEFQKFWPQKLEEMLKGLEKISPAVELDDLWLLKQARNGMSVLFEGAQGGLLDLLYGTHPYITGSGAIAPAIPYAACFPGQPFETLVVIKAYATRVGNGALPTEFGGRRSEEYCGMKNPDGTSMHTKETEKGLDIKTMISSDDEFEIGRAIRRMYNEYGASTGRPRRDGKPDRVADKFVIDINGAKYSYIGLLDTLTAFSKTKYDGIPVAMEYKINGQTLSSFPMNDDILRLVEPVYEILPAIRDDFTGETNYNALPKEAKNYVEHFERTSGSIVAAVGTGPDSEHVAWKDAEFKRKFLDR